MVVLALVALAVNLPGHFPPSGEDPAQDLFFLSEIIGGYALLSLPFDWVGGWWIPCHFERVCFSFPVYLVKWMRGVLVQSTSLVALATLLLFTARTWGSTGAWITFTLLNIALVTVQFPLGRLVGGLSRSRLAQLPFKIPAGARVVAVDSSDPGFSGGITGLPGAERIIIPSHWLRLLSLPVVEAAVQRRVAAIRSGSRTRGLAVAVLWNSLGFGLSTFLIPGATATTVGGLFRTALGCTIWTFVGLLTLPSLSRPAVAETDRLALASGVEKETLALAIRELDQLQDDEARRPTVVETIFHPIPSVDHRLAWLLDPHPPGGGAWHATRTMLFLSWTSFGFLSRAVHCNSGRPELWVLLPAD